MCRNLIQDRLFFRNCIQNRRFFEILFKIESFSNFNSKSNISVANRRGLGPIGSQARKIANHGQTQNNDTRNSIRFVEQFSGSWKI